MSRTLQDFISEIQPLIRDTTGGTVTDSDIRLSANRGIRHLQNRYGMSATKSRESIQIFPNVNEYPAPSDFHDWVALYDRGNSIDFDRLSPTDFWRYLNNRNNTVSVDTILGDKFLQINWNGAGNSALLNSMNGLTDNGTWTADATTDALNIRQDKLNKKYGEASVAFDIDVSQSANNYAAIVNSTITSIDLTDYEDTASAFVWVYIPDVTYTSSVTLRWGSGASAYWEGTETTAFNGQSFRNGWNRVGTSWADASETGSPDKTDVTYLYARVTYSSSETDQTGYAVDRFLMENPSTLELSYTSKYFVKASDGTLQETFSATSDYSLLEDQEADILFYWVLQDAHLIKEQGAELERAKGQFNKALSDWHMRNGSERKRPIFQYSHISRRRR